MSQEIETIGLGGVNYCLPKTDTGYVLIDTGVPRERTHAASF